MKPFLAPTDVDLTDFRACCAQKTSLSDYPHCQEVQNNVAVYDGQKLSSTGFVDSDRSDLKAEFARCLSEGPGILIVRNAFRHRRTVESATELLKHIVRAERQLGFGKGDHFGENERVWNSFQKMCEQDVSVFVDYYTNPWMHLAASSWLGPGYQITAQMNNVKPGARAQTAHRDYHLGFQSLSTVAQFPVHAQIMSQYLTLQGAVAQTDMSLASGPTKLLPYSHQYTAGYLAYHDPEFVSYFEANFVQVPLNLGDMLFFNPAVFHAGGNNSTSRDRIANLLQISSACGKTMESIDHRKLIQCVYPWLVAQEFSDAQIARAVAIMADGYSFPTNLDLDPPSAGQPPQSQQGILRRALAEQWSMKQLDDVLDDYDRRRA